jgi:hypothetical protein
MALVSRQIKLVFGVRGFGRGLIDRHTFAAFGAKPDNWGATRTALHLKGMMSANFFLGHSGYTVFMVG